MHSTVALLFSFFSTAAVIQNSETETASPWKTYGYIVLGGIVLIIAVVVLIRKQHRKFNE